MPAIKRYTLHTLTHIKQRNAQSYPQNLWICWSQWISVFLPTSP